jgi:prepilin-type processing-associated H-X9-DG protein
MRQRIEWKYRTGLVLVELLCVVAILTLLAAFLAPVLAMAREEARGAGCLARERQLGAAFSLYAEDHDDALPLYLTAPPESVWWFDALGPYARSRDLFRCPSLAREGPNYGWNGYGVNYRHLVRYDEPRRRASVTRPAETLLLGDGGDERWEIGWPALYCPLDGPAWQYARLGIDRTAAVSARHRDGANLLWLDGHAGWRRREALLGAVRERGRELWGHYE